MRCLVEAAEGRAAPNSISYFAAAIGPAAIALVVDTLARILRRARRSRRHPSRGRHLHDRRRPERRGYAACKAAGQCQNRNESAHLKAPWDTPPQAVYQK